MDKTDFLTGQQNILLFLFCVDYQHIKTEGWKGSTGTMRDSTRLPMVLFPDTFPYRMIFKKRYFEIKN